MAEASKPKFTFESKGADKNTFSVVRFRGTEGLSSIYRFSIMLISEKSDVDIGSVLQKPAEFRIKRSDGDIPFKGILSSFEQLHQVGKMSFYRAELVPRLWWTTLTHCNQIFLHENAQGYIGDVLQKAGLKQGLSFDFKLQSSYPGRKYVCQYDESHFNFVSRWMERDGMYYYFEQTDQGEKMVITDTHIAHSPMEEGTVFTYSPPNNLDHTKREEIVRNFMLKQQPMPKKVLLKDYNYRKPSLEMKSEAIVSPTGMGEIYIYGEHFKTPGEGNTLAQIRAQEFLCREKVFHSVSTVPYVRAGYIFELKDHYRQDFNQRYLTTDVTHEGSQEAYLVSGLGLNLASDSDRMYYRNSFTCIPAQTQFRAERKAIKPKFSGTMNAKIDASGSGQYAELDSHGRYKVIMPFDESGRNGGKATTWLRMGQPYGGSNHGMHFPLHKGTEVLVTCIDGDPDRPIIQAAAPNPENPSLVNDTNQTKCIIATGGQNVIHMQDKQGSEGLHLKTPNGNTNLRLGSSKTESDSGDGEKDGVWLQTENDIKIGGKNLGKWLLGQEFSLTTGSKEEIMLGNVTEVNAGVKEELNAVWGIALNLGSSSEYTLSRENMRIEKVDLEGDVEELKGSLESMWLTAALMGAEKNELTENLNELRGEHNALVGSHARLIGETSKLVGESSKLTGTVSQLNDLVNSVSAEVTDLCGEVTQLAGGVQTAIGQETATIGETVRALGESTTVAGETNDIAAEMNNIAGLINNI